MKVLRFMTGVLVLLFLAAHPTQLTLPLIDRLIAERLGFSLGIRSVVRANLTLADVLLAAAFGAWALETLLARRWREARTLSVPALALVAAAALSTITALKPDDLGVGRVCERGRAVKELVQLVLYFVCGLSVLTGVLKREGWGRRAFLVLLAVATVAVLAGLYEFLWLRPPGTPLEPGFSTSPMQVDGTFGMRGIASAAHEAAGTESNRNVLAAWLSLALPLLWGVYLCTQRELVRYWTFTLFWAGLATVLSGGLWLAAAVGTLLVAFLRGRRVFLATAAGLFVFAGVFFWLAPQRPGNILLDSLLGYKTVDRYKCLSLYDNPKAYADLYRREDGAVLQGDARFWPWQQKFVEWQPGLVLLRYSPLFGSGIGNYQKNIDLYYENPPGQYYNFTDPNEKPKANLMEPDAIAFYLVWIVEAGLVGLLVWLWLLAESASDGVRNYRFMDDGNARGLVLGAVGALAALALGSFFTSYTVRGVLPALLLVLALVRAGEALEPEMPAGGASGLAPAVERNGAASPA